MAVRHRDYRATRRCFQRVCLTAQLNDAGRNARATPKPHAAIHDLRHTFGVHCAQAGVPISRLQKLLDHASPHTLRYIQHAPENYFAEDAAKVAAGLTGARNREREAQTLATEQLKPA